VVSLPWFVHPYHTSTLAVLVTIASRPSLRTRRRCLAVGGPMIRDYQVRDVVDRHGYCATDAQTVLFGEDD